MFRKKTFPLFVFLFGVWLASIPLYSQKTSVKASFEPSDILIGQQAVLQLDVTAAKGVNIVFPQYTDILIAGVDLLATLPLDTILTGNSVVYSQKYLLTSFDSATYNIPHIEVFDGVDTLRSNQLVLKVTSPTLSDSTIASIEEWSKNPSDTINFSKGGITDIKPIQKPPFIWQDYLDYILLGLFVLLLIIALAVGLFLYSNKKKKGYFIKPKIVLPPHVIALTALNEAKQNKLWQQGRVKEYYTDLTDILRRYIEGRFGISVFEKTSHEILSVMKNNLDRDSSMLSLKQVLETADLVKFAKYTPMIDENDLSLMNAFLFVNQTKKEDSQNSSKTDDHAQSKLLDDDDDTENIDWNISNINDKNTSK